MGKKNDDMLECQVREWIEKKFGKRCQVFEEGCVLCEMWRCFDYIFTDKLVFDFDSNRWTYPKKVRKMRKMRRGKEGA